MRHRRPRAVDVFNVGGSIIYQPIQMPVDNFC